MQNIRLSELEAKIAGLLSLVDRVQRLEAKMDFVEPQAKFVYDKKNPLEILTKRVDAITETVTRQTETVIPKLEQNIADVKKAVQTASDAAQTATATATKANKLANYLNSDVVPKINANIEKIDSLVANVVENVQTFITRFGTLADSLQGKVQQLGDLIDQTLTHYTQVVNTIQAEIKQFDTRVAYFQRTATRIAQLTNGMTIWNIVGRSINIFMHITGWQLPAEWRPGLLPNLQDLIGEIGDTFNATRAGFANIGSSTGEVLQDIGGTFKQISSELSKLKESLKSL